MGLGIYFRQFVTNFAIIAKPLTSLFRKTENWSWGNTQILAFKCLNGALINRPVLGIFHSNAPTEVQMDASKVGLTGISFCKPIERKNYFEMHTIANKSVFRNEVSFLRIKNFGRRRNNPQISGIFDG